MTRDRLSIAIVGAGIGGLAAAAALRRVGHDVAVYEQAHAFARIGAGIQQAPNAVKVLRGLGLEERLGQLAARPDAQMNRVWDTGEVKWNKPMGSPMADDYGAPYFHLHRGDLHMALAEIVPEGIVHRDRKLVDLSQDADAVTLEFEDGGTAQAEIAIGADGVHSVVRQVLLGVEKPQFSGRVAYRTTFPAARLGDVPIDDYAKWWGPDRHIVIYYITPNKDEIYFVTSTPEPDFTTESYSAKGDLATLRKAYEGFHPHVRAVLAACPEVYKWALYVRDPLPRWGRGRVTLLGDSCHPMTPYMAQGAATSIEDAAVLSRCLDGIGAGDAARALRRYEDSRRERTARIQTISRLNDMDRIREETDRTYRYDAWTAPLAPMPEAVEA